MPDNLSTDVLIVGAGPVGLALAIVLQKSGVNYLIIEKNSAFHTTSRAAVIHSHTLDALKSIGVTDQLLQAGTKLSKFSMRDRDSDLVNLNFEKVPGDHNFLLMIPQDVTEDVLRKKLSELGGRLMMGSTANRITQTQKGADVTCFTQQGELLIHSRYVIGTDGMNSIVRESAGIQFDGERYEESFILADTVISGSLERDRVSLFFSPSGLVVVAPLPNGAFRIVATVDQAPEVPSISDIQHILDERGPSDRNKAQSIRWSSRFRIHHRLARHYRKGALFLAGDAAHVHSPAGGQGMNTGLVDAITLGNLLSDVIQNHKPESSLDEYELIRRPAAQQVLHLAGRMTKLAVMKGFFRRMMRNQFLKFLGFLPAFKDRMVADLSGQSRAGLARISGPLVGFAKRNAHPDQPNVTQRASNNLK